MWIVGGRARRGADRDRPGRRSGGLKRGAHEANQGHSDPEGELGRVSPEGGTGRRSQAHGGRCAGYRAERPGVAINMIPDSPPRHATQSVDGGSAYRAGCRPMPSRSSALGPHPAYPILKEPQVVSQLIGRRNGPVRCGWLVVGIDQTRRLRHRRGQVEDINLVEHPDLQ